MEELHEEDQIKELPANVGSMDVDDEHRHPRSGPQWSQACPSDLADIREPDLDDAQASSSLTTEGPRFAWLDEGAATAGQPMSTRGGSAKDRYSIPDGADLPRPVAQRRDELLVLARRARRCLLRADLEVGLGDGRCDALLCDLACELLVEHLPGDLTILGDPAGHWWVEVDGWAVDITAEQRGVLGGVIVCRSSACPWVPKNRFHDLAEFRAFTEHVMVERFGELGRARSRLTDAHDRPVKHRFRELWAGSDSARACLPGDQPRNHRASKERKRKHRAARDARRRNRRRKS